MTENTSNSFNIQPLVFEIENVIKNGLKEILKNYTDRYNLLEKTHQQIMKLPSVMNEINKDSHSEAVSESVSESKHSSSFNNNISILTRELIKNEILHVESKLDRIEKKYESISPLISKILDKLESINDEVKVLKEKSIDNIKIEPEKPYISNIIKPSLVSACENENIKFEINESESEDDNNPSLVESSNISLNQEIKSNEQEQSDNEEEEASVVEENVDQNGIKETEAIEEEEEVEEEDVEEEEEVEEEEVEEEEVEEKVEVEQEEVEEDEVETEANDEDEVETEASHEDEVETEASDEDEATELDTISAPTKVEEEELAIITIDDADYCTNDEENGFIWELSEEGEQGDKIGYLKDGEPFFYADEK